MVEQGFCIVDAIQNYNPHVLVVDELRVKADVQAARQCKNHGIRILASVSRGFEQLVLNTNRRSLLLPENDMKGHGQQPKLTSVFDCLVELRGDQNALQIVMDPETAAKALLCNEKISAETRVRATKVGSTSIV